MTIIAIIQARMGSTRLPGKVMKRICKQPLLWHVVDRAMQAYLIDMVVVATSTNEEDDVIEQFCIKSNIGIYRGHPTDVLARYYDCAEKYIINGANIQYIVRITADCPVIDPVETDKVIQLAIEERLDYASNVYPITYPIGLSVEVFTFDALSDAYHNAKLPSEREHVTPYIVNNKKLRHGNVKNPVDISGFLPLRWTVDYIEDFKLIRAIYNNLYPKNPRFLMKDILRLLKEKPELQHINCHIPANEGYQKSLEEDKKFLEEKKL